MACPPIPSWLVNKATSFFWHQAKQKFNTFHKPTTMWKTTMWGLLGLWYHTIRIECKRGKVDNS
jgi:hypothetical protein